jgi:hypothetical protein
VKVEPFSQVYDLWVHVDVVQDVRDEAIFLAELRLIVEEGATLFKREAEVTNDLRQWAKIVTWWAKCSNPIILQVWVRGCDDSFDGIETGVKTMQCVAEFDVALR